jgi:hypothetical protein
LNITDADLVRCAERELRLRRRVYPRQVANGKMSQEDADHETEAMSTILALFRERTEPSLI